MSDAPRHRALAPGDVIAVRGTWLRLCKQNSDGTWTVLSINNRNRFTIDLNGSNA